MCYQLNRNASPIAICTLTSAAAFSLRVNIYLQILVLHVTLSPPI